MSTYYEYQDVKRMIAHKLMNLEGWTVYGYHADESDSMTDYYHPAYWGGVAEKNGYILCVNVYGASEGEDVKKYTNANAVDRSIYDKIAKLEEMTVERGATEAEQATAQKRIDVLKTKLSEQEEQAKEYIVMGHIPGHMANPPRMNWHIEKDGKYIAKGNGILKYAAVDQYYRYGHYSDAMRKFRENPQKWLEDLTEGFVMRGTYDTDERCREVAQYRFNEMQKDAKLVEQFENFVNKLDVMCGGIIGNGEQETYKTVTVTEYKTETKAKETASGEVADGQCFIVKSHFNYGICKGYVYRIHADQHSDGTTYYKAYKLNGKLTKECHGMATAANSWFIGKKDGISYNKFMKWINDGSLSWCELEEVKTPYEVEKVVKNTVKTDRGTKAAATKTSATDEEFNAGNYTFEVTEDTDTRDNSKIYLVKVAEKLSREEYLQMNKHIKSLGGYYSKFKHAFLFKDDPTEILKGEKIESMTESAENIRAEQTEQAAPAVSYTITEDEHTKTHQKIWIAKPTEKLNKSEFAKIKLKLATIKGFYSTFKQGFIFSYDPTEALQTG